MSKPLILKIEDAKQEIVASVNSILQKHNLNCYLIEPIFTEIHSQITANAQNELAQAREQMLEEEEQGEKK